MKYRHRTTLEGFGCVRFAQGAVLRPLDNRFWPTRSEVRRWREEVQDPTETFIMLNYQIIPT